MKRILVIEDQAVMRKNLVFILKLEGFLVEEAGTGEEGLRLAQEAMPDLILCDISMPGMDGLQVLGALRRLPGFSRTPFVFLTARGEREDVRLGMNTGADDYLTKPVEHAELMACVRSRLDRAASIRRESRQGRRTEPDFSRLDLLQSAFQLTPREAEVLSWLAQGKTNSEIALLLNTTERTVKHHVGRCLEKANCENRTSATLAAIEVLSRYVPAPGETSSPIP